MKYWVDDMTEFRRSIHRKITSPPCELETWANTGNIDSEHGLYMISIPFEEFYIGFLLDDTDVRSSRPGSGPNGNYVGALRRIGAQLFQRAFYSGYFRGHGLKFQNVLLPNVLYGSVWGASLSYNDTGILNMSGLVDYLYSILQPTPSGHLPCGLGDGIFVESAVIMSTKLNHETSRDEKR